MLPSPLITVLAPHWTGRFRKYKRGTEREGPGLQVHKREEAPRVEVDYNENDHKLHQITCSRDMQSQRSLGNPPGGVYNTGSVQVSVTQEKPLPSRSGQSAVGWLPENSLSSWTPNTATAPNSLSTSVSSDLSRGVLDNRRRATVNYNTSPVHQGTAHSSSVDLSYQRTSLVNQQDPSWDQVSKSSSPSSFLLYLRKVTSLRGNSEKHSLSASSPLPDTQSHSAVRMPTGPEDPKSTSRFRVDQQQFGRVDKPDQLFHLNNQSAQGTTLPLTQHSQPDAATSTKEGSNALGYYHFYPELTGSSQSHITNTTNNPNNNISSFNTRGDYGVFGRPTLQVPDIYNITTTQSSHTLNSPTAHCNSSSQTSPNTPPTPNSSSRLSPVFQPLSPSHTWGQKENGLNSPVSSLTEENYLFEKTVPTHTWKVHLDYHSAAMRRNRFHASSSLTSLTSPTLPRQCVDTSVTDSQMALSSPTLSTKSLQRMDSTRIQEETTLLKSPTKSLNGPERSFTLSPILSTECSESVGNATAQCSKGPNTHHQTEYTSPTSLSNSLNNSRVQSPVLPNIQLRNMNDSNIQSLNRSPSSIAAIKLENIIQANDLNTGDTACTDSMTLPGYPMLPSRPVRSVDSPMPYSSLRQSSPPKATSPIQRSPGPNLQGGELHVSLTVPSPEERIMSWRQHYFHRKKQLWSTGDFEEQRHTNRFQRLSSAPSDSTRTPDSTKPVTPSPFPERHLSQKSLDAESETVPVENTGNSSSIHTDSPVNNLRMSEGREKLSAQPTPFRRLQRQMAEVSNYVPWETPKATSITVDSSRLPFQQQPIDLISARGKWTNVVSSLNSESSQSAVSADPPDEFIQLCNSNPVLQTTESSSVNSLLALRSPSAAPTAKRQETTEKLPSREEWPVVESQMECLKDQSSKQTLLTIKSNENQFGLSSPFVTTKPPIPHSKGARADPAGNKNGNKVDVILNRIKMTFSSKRSDSESLNSKKSRRETAFTLSRKSDVALNETSDIKDVLKISDYDNKTAFTGRAQVSRLSPMSPRSENKLFEAHKQGSALHNLTNTNGNHLELRSQRTPPKRQTLSPNHYSIIPGPRKSSISPRTSELQFDFDSEDTDSENVFYSKRSLERQSKKPTTKTHRISFSRQFSEGENVRKPFQSRSHHNSYNEGHLYSSTFSDFSLKGGRSFSVSSIHASRPSRSARMATIPRMASVDNLANMCVFSGSLGRQSKALSYSLDQNASRNRRWDLVTMDQIQPLQKMENSCSLRDEDLSPSPPPSPTYSPRPISRPPSFSTASSMTSQDSLSSRGRLPSRGYRSSLSAFDESDSDTTTDDEYYLSGDKGERETEL